jgi:hypothetical protein
VPSTTDFADARLREELVRQKRQLDDERTTLRDRDMRLTEDRMLLDAELAAFAADRDAAIAAAVATALAATEEAKASTAAQNSPPSSPKHRHRPVSPSPMSPLRRTPGKSHAHQHVAVRRRVAPRTPLSRLVLERATLDRDRRKVSGSSLGEGNLSAKFAASRTGPPSAPGSAAPAPLGASARENVDVFAEPSQEGKARDDPKIRTSLGDKEVRKSSLHASTAASAARAKSDKVLSNGARSGAALAGHPLAKGSTARAWR